MNLFTSAMSGCKQNIEKLGIHKYPKNACGITKNYNTI